MTLDTRHNLTSPAVPPCLVTERGVPCDREGRYWMTLQATNHPGLRYSIGACTEHVATARAASGTPEATFTVEQVSNRHPFYERTV